jgi:hypothetical protein
MDTNINTTLEVRNKREGKSNLKSFGLDQVLLTNDYYVNALQKDVEYLLAFDAKKLLAGFYDTAGINIDGVTRYEGWENLLIGGHTIGHYLTACVNAYMGANTPEQQKTELLDMITMLIHGLKECQEAIGTGYLFAAPLLDRDNIELQFDHVENNRTNIFTQAWVPWYTMHKIFEGLISVAAMKTEAAKEVAGEALHVLTKLGEWTYNRTMSWSQETRKTVLGIEYGGMNDCLYDLYQLTGNEMFADAAHAFDQTELFEKIYHGKKGDHVLNNYHANTTIPKFAGALNRYISYMDDESVEADIYLEYAKAFWDMVVNHHTYITGGNSEWEHFGLDGILDGERTNCNNETCNAYNMLKMTMKLFMITGEAKYADYYENTFINSIMSSQNPETGMTTYFQPMATGFFKVYGERFTKFWCCTGSGMENFSKLGESFYFHKDNLLVVNQYISSVLMWEEKGVKVKQVSNLPANDKVDITLESTRECAELDITIALRLPEWLLGTARIVIDGNEYEYENIKGYAYISGPLKTGTSISITLPMEVKAFSLPDQKDIYGFKYGPVVLSALLGTSDMEESTTGVIVTIPLAKNIENVYTKNGDDVITVLNDSVDEFIANINKYLIRDVSAGELRFTLTNTDANLTFVPHYSQHKERYGIYWYFVSEKDQLEGRSGETTEYIRLDTVQPGYGQYENDDLHNLQESGSGSTGQTLAGTSRYANASGSFSYRMVVDTKNGTSLIATLKKEDSGKTLRILVKDTIVYELILPLEADTDEYDVAIKLPNEVLKEHVEMVEVNGHSREAVVFTFEGAKGEASARICNFLYSIQR